MAASWLSCQSFFSSRWTLPVSTGMPWAKNCCSGGASVGMSGTVMVGRRRVNPLSQPYFGFVAVAAGEMIDGRTAARRVHVCDELRPLLGRPVGEGEKLLQRRAVQREQMLAAGLAMEFARVAATAFPILALPGMIAGRALRDLLDDRLRQARPDQRVIVGIHRAETRRRRAVRDAPRANLAGPVFPRCRPMPCRCTRARARNRRNAPRWPPRCRLPAGPGGR